MSALVARIPLFARKFLVDFIETGIPVVLGLSFGGDRDALIHTALIGVGAAAIAAARRALPDFSAWLASVFGTQAA